jgi:hypothetical protein
MVRRAFVLVVVGACTPVAEPIADAVPPSAPVTETDRKAERTLRDEMGLCTQTYPPQWGAPPTPWIWDSTEAHDDPASPSCRLGCSIGPTRSSWSYDGLTVSLLDHGDLAVNSDERRGVWQKQIDLGDSKPSRVRWTTWCGPNQPLVLAAYDEQRLALVALDRTSGEELARAEEWLSDDRSPLAGLGMQMYCHVDGIQLHAKSDRGAWLSSYSSDTLERLEHRDVPAALADPGAPADDHDGWVALPHLPRDEYAGGPIVDLGPHDRVDTSERRYRRVGYELFALDWRGDPLWHRVAVTERPGCTDWFDSLVGCSRCPNPSQHLARFEDWIVLRTYDVRSTVDVFDAEGAHVIHIAE